MLGKWMERENEFVLGCIEAVVLQQIARLQIALEVRK